MKTDREKARDSLIWACVMGLFEGALILGISIYRGFMVAGITGGILITISIGILIWVWHVERRYKRSK
jgi:hypothetical protein